jgi:hypothetical protein
MQGQCESDGAQMVDGMGTAGTFCTLSVTNPLLATEFNVSRAPEQHPPIKKRSSRFVMMSNRRLLLVFTKFYSTAPLTRLPHETSST